MDYSFKPCHFTDNLHDLPKEAIGKLFKFSGGDSVTVRQHLNRFTCVMILYCRFPQYNHEDFKMRLFVHSLEGDALNWFNNFPNDFFTSLQDILNAFKDRYDSPNSLPSTSKIVQKEESNHIKGPAVEDNSSCQNVSSTGNIVDQVHDREIDSMTFNHNNQLADMQANHKEEINSMQHCSMDIKEKNDKVIKHMQEQHAIQISAIRDECSSQMDAIRIQVQKIQQWSDDKRNQEPSHWPQQVPSYYEEVIRWLIEGDPYKLKNDKNQMQDTKRLSMHILHTSSDSFETESSRSSVIRPARKKKRKRKKIRRRFDASDGREQLDFRIGKSPTICKIGHGTSDKQPTDLPESRQMLSMHYIEHI